MADDPPYLTVGTEVSAKYKGAFCEAKIRKVVRVVKCKVTFKAGNGSALVADVDIRGQLKVGHQVEAKHPDKNQFLEATVNKIQDSSQYTVVFDDGDITTLRRSALCLKSGRHFNESETLDQLPLTHPEHFSNPVVGGRRGVRRRAADKEESSEEEDEEIPTKSRESRKRVEKELDMGKVVCVESTDKKKSKDTWFPALVVSPSAQETAKIRIKDEYLVRSFRDGRYYTVPKKEITLFTSKDSASKFDSNSNVLRSAVDKAVLYIEKNELPPHWDRDVLFGNARQSESGEGEDQQSESEVSEDDPRNEEKDRFIAQLYKFMDDRSTPLNKVPQVCSRDLDLYDLYKVVDSKGGYTKVTNQSQWKSVTLKLGYGTMPSTSTINLVKQAYKKFLFNFEEFYRKLGCTWTPRTATATTSKSRSSRSIFRERGRPTSSSRESRKGADDDEGPGPGPGPLPSTSKRDREAKEKGSADREKPPASSPEVDSPDTGSESSEVKPKVVPEEKEKTTEEPRKSARGRQPKKDRDAEEVASLSSSSNTSASSRKRRQTASSASRDRDRRESSVASSTKDEGSSAPPTPSSSTTASPSKKSVAGAPPPAAAAATPTAGGRGKYKRSTKGGESEENIEQIVKEEEKPVESKPIPATKTSVGIRLGDKLEVYYPKSEGKTYEAKVIDINEKDGTFLVHYTGWNNRYDEWIDQSRVSENITLKLELSGESETKDISRPPSSTGNMSSSKGQNVKQRKGRNSSSATSSTSASSTTTPSLASGTRSGSSKAAAAAAAASTAASTSIGSKRRRSTSAEVVQVPSVPKRRRTRQKSGQDTSAASTAASDSEGETSDSDGKSIKSEKAPSIIKDIESKTATKEIKDKDVPTNVPVTPPSASDSKQIETKKVEEKEVKSSGHVGRPSKAEKEKKLELADVDDEISSGSAASTKSTSKSKDKDKEPGKMGTSEDTKESSSSSISSGVSGQVIDLDEIRSEMKGLDKMVKSAPGVGPTPQSSASSPAPPTLSAAVGSSPPPPEPTKVDIYEFQDEATDDSAPSITVTAPKLKMFSPVGRSTAAAQDKAPVVVSASAAELVTKLKSQQTQDQEKAPVPIVAIETLDKSLSPSKTTPGEPTIEASTSTTKTPSSSSSHSTPPPLPTKSSKEDTKVISLPVVSVITTPVVPTPATPAATPSKLSTTSSQSHVPVISTPTTAPSLTPPATTVVSLTLLSTPPLPVLASPTPIPSTTSTITSPSMYSSPAPTLVSVNPVIPATSTPVIMTPVSNFKPRTLLGTTSVRVPMPSTAASSVLTPRSIFTTAVTASSTTTPTPTTSVPPPPPVFMPSSVIASTTASATTTSAPRPMLVPVSIPSATLLQSSQTPVVSTHTPPTLLNQQQQRPLLSVSGGGIPRAGVITITSSVASSTNTITGRPSLAPVIAASIAAVGSKVDPKSHQLSTPFGGRKQEIFPHLIQQSTADSSATSSIPTISIVSSKHVSMEGEIQQAQQIHQPPPPLPSSVQQQQQPLKIAAAIPSVPPNQPPPPPVIVKAPLKGPVFGPGPISGTPTDSPKPKKKKAKAAMSSNVPVKTMAPLPSSGAPPPPPVIVPTSTTSTITLTPTPGRKTPVKKRIPPPMESPGKSTKPLGLLSGAPVKQGKMKPEAMNAAIANVGASPTMTIAVPTTVITSTSTIYQTQPSTGMMFASTTSAPPPLPQPPPTPVSITKVGLPVTIKSSAESIAASIAAVASMGSSMSMKSTPPITASSIAPKSNFPMKRFMKDSPSDRMGLNKDKGSFVPHPHSIQQGPPPPPPSTIVIGKSLVPMSESLQQQPPPPSQPPITIQAKFQPVTAHSIAGTQGIPSGPAVTFVKATPTPPGGPGGAHHILDPHPHSTHSHHHQVHSQANLPKHPVIIIPAAPVVIKPTPYQHSQQQQQQQQHATIQPVIVSKPIQIEGSQPPQHSAQQQLQQPPPSVLVSATTQTGTGGVVKQSVLPITVTPSVQLSSVSVLQSSSPSLLSTVPPLPTVSVSATPLHPAIEMKPVTCGEPSITVTKATTVMKSISPDIVAVSNYSSRGSSSSNVFTPVRHDERMSKEPEIVVKPAPASAQIVFHTTTSQQDHSRKVEAGPSLPAITIIPKIDVKEPDENSLLCEEIIPGSPTTGEDAEDKLDDEDKREKEKDSNEKKKPSEEISTPASPPHPPAAISPVSPVLPPSPPLGSGSGNKPVIVLGPKYGEEEEEEDSRFVFVDERKYPRFGDDDDDDKIDDDNSVDSPMGPPSEGREADLQFRDSFSDAGDHSPPSTPSTTSTISTDESLRQRDTSRMSPTPEGGSSKSKDSDDDDMDSDVGSKSTHVDDGDSKHGSTRGSTRIRNQNRQGRSPSPPMGKRRRIMRRNKSPEESSRYTPRTVRTSSGRKVTPVGRDIDSGREREKEVKQTPPPPLVNLAKPPKTGKYNFIPNLTGLNDPDQRITLITQAINDLREQYQKTKNEAASFDRKVKRWKRRTREKERLARQEANRAAS